MAEPNRLGSAADINPGSLSCVLSRLLRNARALCRRLRIGGTVLAVRHVLSLGIGRTLQMHRAKRRYLEQISDARVPTFTNTGVEVHMLLEHARVLEGMWAFYSLVQQSGELWSLVVHDDGSLTEIDQQRLQRVFPSTHIISRRTADSVVDANLQELGLTNCRVIRQKLPFALKLIDVILLARRDKVVLLDSDVLFFQRPTELMTAVKTEDDGYVFMEDIDDHYCLNPASMARHIGNAPIHRFNPGVAVVPTRSIDLNKVERYLKQPEFWSGNQVPNYYAELTLWAMLMSSVKAKPLPHTYAVSPAPRSECSIVCGHYCGGPAARHVFYAYAMPAVRKSLAHSNVLNADLHMSRKDEHWDCLDFSDK